MRFDCGKFAGITPEELLGMNEDRYLQFVSTCDEWKNKEMLRYVRSRIVKDTHIQFGKYKDSPLHHIKNNHESYWNWLLQLSDNDPRLGYLRYV